MPVWSLSAPELAIIMFGFRCLQVERLSAAVSQQRDKLNAAFDKSGKGAAADGHAPGAPRADPEAGRSGPSFSSLLLAGVAAPLGAAAPTAELERRLEACKV